MGVSKIAQWVQEPDDPSSIPGTHMEGENQLQEDGLLSGAWPVSDSL